MIRPGIDRIRNLTGSSLPLANRSLWQGAAKLPAATVAATVGPDTIGSPRMVGHFNKSDRWQAEWPGAFTNSELSRSGLLNEAPRTEHWQAASDCVNCPCGWRPGLPKGGIPVTLDPAKRRRIPPQLLHLEGC